MRPLSYETRVQEIVDEHSPQKQKYLKKESPPFTYSELRRAIYKKKMFYKHKGKTNWENYRKQRNYVTKLRKQLNYISLKGVVVGQSQRIFGLPLNLFSAQKQLKLVLILSLWKTIVLCLIKL